MLTMFVVNYFLVATISICWNISISKVSCLQNDLHDDKQNFYKTLQNQLDETKHDRCNNQESEKGIKEIDELGDLNKWANNLSILKQQDRDIVNHMKDLVRQQERNPNLVVENPSAFKN